MIVEPFETWPSSTNSNSKPKAKPTPAQTKSWEKAYSAADAGSLGAQPKSTPPPPASVPDVPAITDPEAASGFVASTGAGSMLNESQAQRQRDQFEAAVAPMEGFVASTGVGSMLNESEAQRQRDEFEAAIAPTAGFVAGTGVGSMLNESEANRQRDAFEAAIAPTAGFVAGTGVGSMLNESGAQRNRDELGERADQLIDDHTSHPRGHRQGRTFSATGIAYELQALKRDDPAQAAILEDEIINRLDGDRLEQFQNAMNKVHGQEQAAYGLLASYDLPEGDGDIILSEEAVLATADDILDRANTTSSTRGGGTRHHFDANEVEYQLDTLAQRDPALAIAVKQELDSRLTPDQVGEVNRLLGGGANFGDNLASAGNHPGQAAIGVAKYVGNIPSDLGEFASWAVTLGQHPVDLPQFEYSNSAQRGGAVVGTIGEIALAGKGLISIAGRKIVVKAAGEAVETGARHGDNIGRAAGDLPNGAAIERRFAELASEGHGPGRHGPDVTPTQLHNRVVYGFDPLTNTALDGVTYGTHKAQRNATRITSTEAYVQAERAVQGSEEFEDAFRYAVDHGDDSFVVEIPLDDALGSDYLSHVDGRTRVGSVKNPSGSTTTDLTDGTMYAVYEFNDGSFDLITMYPRPKK